MDRREFLTVAGGTVLAGGACAWGASLLTVRSSERLEGEGASAGQRWGMLIDLTKCRDGCTACMDACRKENNVPYFGDPDDHENYDPDHEKWDIHWIRKVQIKSKARGQHKEKTVLLLCNHCDDPPCAQVCPVQATYKRADGIVLVDHHRCIGCRYCVMSCPYNARYFNFKHDHKWPNQKYPKRSHGVAESCHLCAHLLDRGQPPACVAACDDVAQAIAVGDLNDPDEGVWYGGPRLSDTEHTPKRIREDHGTEPKVYYYGL